MNDISLHLNEDLLYSILFLLGIIWGILILLIFSKSQLLTLLIFSVVWYFIDFCNYFAVISAVGCTIMYKYQLADQDKW